MLGLCLGARMQQGGEHALVTMYVVLLSSLLCTISALERK